MREVTSNLRYGERKAPKPPQRGIRATVRRSPQSHRTRAIPQESTFVRTAKLRPHRGSPRNFDSREPLDHQRVSVTFQRTARSLEKVLVITSTGLRRSSDARDHRGIYDRDGTLLSVAFALLYVDPPQSHRTCAIPPNQPSCEQRSSVPFSIGVTRRRAAPGERSHTRTEPRSHTAARRTFLCAATGNARRIRCALATLPNVSLQWLYTIAALRASCTFFGT